MPHLHQVHGDKLITNSGNDAVETTNELFFDFKE